MKKYSKLLLIAGTALGLSVSACMTSSVTMRKEVAQRIAAPAWMVERQVEAGLFSLTAYERMHQRYAPADIYIEGDGFAWLSKTQKSRNPTPKNPVGLHLAAYDKAENVAYLARPCQYSGAIEKDEACSNEYWGQKRFSPGVIASYNAALDDIKKRWNITEFNLIGFSGGGAVAALLAAERHDIASLRTVAGNLDHKTQSAIHGVSILEDSLNPVDYADKLATVPQYHFIGGQDDIVPPEVLHSYLQALGDNNCVQYELIQDAAHEEGWVNKWPGLLAKTPECKQDIVPEPVFEVIEPPEPIIVPRETPVKP